MAGLTLREATASDFPALRAELLAGDHEIVDFGRALVVVAEDADGLAGFASARPIVQLEPLLLARRTERASAHFRRRATLALARAADEMLRPMGAYYAAIGDPVMWGLAENFGYRRVYAGKRWYLREVG